MRGTLQPRAILFFVGPAAGFAASAQKQRIQVVQLSAARERIEPHILVSLALVDGTNAEATLEEETEWTVRRLFQIRHRKGGAVRAGIEHCARVGHITVELGELFGRARVCGLAAERDTAECGADRLFPLAARAEDAAQPPSTRRGRSIPFRRHDRLRLPERRLHFFI